MVDHASDAMLATYAERLVKFGSLSDLEGDQKFEQYYKLLYNTIKAYPRSIKYLRGLMSDRQMVDAAISKMLREGRVADEEDARGGTIYRAT